VLRDAFAAAVAAAVVAATGAAAVVAATGAAAVVAAVWGVMKAWGR